MLPPYAHEYAPFVCISSRLKLQETVDNQSPERPDAKGAERNLLRNVAAMLFPGEKVWKTLSFLREFAFRSGSVFKQFAIRKMG
jgi:hypothetical protein